MSFEAMAWASKQKTGSNGRKLVLMMLANHCNGHTGQCNPSHKRMAEECEMGASTLRKHIFDLAEQGFLTIVPKFVDGVQLPNQYNLHLDRCSNLAEGMPEMSYPPAQIELQNQEFKPVIKPNTSVVQGKDNFEVFWKAYPRKTNKGFAKKVFDKLKPTDDLLKKMLHSIEQQKPHWKDPQYIPHPSTWLNGERWEDEVSVTRTNNPFAGGI